MITISMKLFIALLAFAFLFGACLVMLLPTKWITGIKR